MWMLCSSMLCCLGSWVQLHPLTHEQFISKAHHSETKFEKGASDRNSQPVKGRVKYRHTSLQMYSEHLRACAVQLRPRLQVSWQSETGIKSRIVITDIMLWVNQICDQIMNIISTEFACAGRCSACVKGKRSVQYCQLIKEHDDDKSELCVNCYKAKSDQSVAQCRQVLGHKGSNALMTEPL